LHATPLQAALRAEAEEHLRTSTQFKAKPVHIAESTKNWSQLQEEQAAVRKARVEQRAAELSAKACLPPRMALHEATKAATARSAIATTAAGTDDSKPLLSQSLPPEKVGNVQSVM
jgi:Uncharacterised protein family UPF0564